MALGDLVQGTAFTGLTGAAGSLGVTPTVGNTMVAHVAMRPGGAMTAPAGWTMSPAGITAAFNISIASYLRVVQSGDTGSYNTGALTGPTVVRLEEREGTFSWDANSVGAASPDPTPSHVHTAPSVSPLSGR